MRSMAGATGYDMARRGGGLAPCDGDGGAGVPARRRRGRVREAFRGLGALVGYVAVMAVITLVALVLLWRVSHQ